jgi:quercetin dioxygenase-like cupin family protein
MPHVHFVDEHASPFEGRPGYSWKTLISADRAPTTDITQGVAELAPAPVDLDQLHRHPHAETYYVISGTGFLWIDEEPHPLAPGMTAFIPGGTLHTANATGTEPLRILYTFAADSFTDVGYEYPRKETAA